MCRKTPPARTRSGSFAYPFGGEKLCVVLNVFRYGQFDEAVEIVNACHRFSGLGHSCGIHTKREDRVMELAARTYTSRVMVNQATSLANSGSFTNGMPFTLFAGVRHLGRQQRLGKHHLQAIFEQYLGGAPLRRG